MKYHTRIFVIFLIALLILSTAAIAGERENRVRYGDFRTGEGLQTFLIAHAGLERGKGESWTSFSRRENEIWAPAPEKRSLSSVILDKMKVHTISTKDNRCGASPRQVFLERSNGKAEMYAYEFNICDSSGLIDPVSSVEQYIRKYGMYDSKNYDRDMVIYDNVKKRFRVGAHPYNSENGVSGATVTIVDSVVFDEVYADWKVALRKAAERLRMRF